MGSLRPKYLLFGAIGLMFVYVLFGVSDPHSIEIVVWACTASSLFVADLLLQVQEILRTRPRTANVRPAAPVLESV